MWKTGVHRPLVLLSKEDISIKNNKLGGKYEKLLEKLLRTTDLEGIEVLTFNGTTEAKNTLSEVDPDLIICFGARACSEATVKGWKNKNLKGVVEVTHKGKVLPEVIRVAVLLPKLSDVHASLEKDYDNQTKTFSRDSQTHNVFENLKEAKKYIDYVQQFKD